MPRRNRVSPPTPLMHRRLLLLLILLLLLATKALRPSHSLPARGLRIQCPPIPRTASGADRTSRQVSRVHQQEMGPPKAILQAQQSHSNRCSRAHRR